MSLDFRGRLRTADADGNRIWVYAAIFDGIWRKRRRLLAFLLIIIYISVPWLHYQNLPVFQLDLRDQRLIFWGRVFWPHELVIFIPLVLAFIFGLFALTAKWGRIWCGWGCPQTVFLEFLYRPIEQRIEGRPSERKKRDNAVYDFSQFTKKMIKWGLFAAVSFVVANSFLAYFVGGRELLRIMSHPPDHNPGLFILMASVFGGFLFNFGWFREQMCTIACPYGRLQSMLVDKQTLIVGYNSKRGEPRGKGKGGDCVDCGRCVQVCPARIDIRDGLQLECINCAACIDACNAVMAKVKKPLDLISYTSEEKLKGVMSRKSPRVWVYATVSMCFVLFTIVQAATRSNFDVEIARSSAVQFETLNGQVQNRVQFIIENKSTQILTVAPEAIDHDTELIVPIKTYSIPAEDKLQLTAFVKVPTTAFIGGTAHRKLAFVATTGETKTLSLTLFGPQK